MTRDDLPTTPRGFQHSLTERAKSVAETEKSGDTRELVERFFHRLIVARVFAGNPTGWLLKGGQALLVRWPGARYSTDIDLLHTDAGIHEAVTALRAAVDQQDLMPMVHFKYLDRTLGHQEREICKVTFAVHLGNKRLQKISVDVVTGLHPRGNPVAATIESPFAFPATEEWPEARMWPLEDHVADKIAAMYEMHPGGRPSSRVKDLVDLVLIALRSPLHGTTTHAALRSEVTRRTAAGTRVTLPQRFEIPDPSWGTGYNVQARNTPSLPLQYRTLTAARPLADTFITPILQPQPPASWDPASLVWTDGR